MGIVLALALVGGSTQAQITFSNVADTTMTAPGKTLQFNGFFPPSINAGTIGVLGYDTAGRDGAYTRTAGASGLSRIADNTVEGGAIPNFTGRVPTSGGNVAFIGYSSGNTLTAYSGVVGNTGSTPVIIGSGNNVTLSGNTLATSSGNAISTATAGTTGSSVLVSTSTAVPGQSGTFTNVGAPFLSGSTAVFTGTYYVGMGSSSTGLYAATIGGSGPVRIADASTAIPGRTDTFTYFDSNPSISAGKVAFVGGNNSVSGLYTGNVAGGLLTLVADTTTAAPGGNGSAFYSFGGEGPAISGNNVAFLALFTSGAVTDTTGIFLSLDGKLVNVVYVGESLFGSTVSSLELANNGLDGNTVAFEYALSNGLSGIATALVPEPSTWVSLGLGVAGLGLALRRRFARA